MTATMVLPEHAAHGGGTAVTHSRLGRRLFSLLRQAALAAIPASRGRRAGSPSLAPIAGREIAAIGTFAHFMAKHPDMPADHRARCLRHILRNCEELREAL